MMPRLVPILLAALAVGACQTGANAPAQRAATPDAGAMVRSHAACWASDRIPAQERVVFDERVIREATRDSAGRITAEAVVERMPRTLVEHPAEDRLFAVPCPDQLTGDVVTALQRALIVRGLLDGRPSGVMDEATREAVRAFQRPQGLDSRILSLEAAWQLGLLPVPRDAL